MKVGVDARLLSRPITGIGRYTIEMCQALAKVRGLSLYLYSPAPIPYAVMKGLGETHIRTKNWNNGLLRQFWTESYLPSWAKKDQVDIFWGPAHRLPLCLPSHMARVVTIHDLVWKYAGDTMRPLSRLLERYQMPLSVKKADKVVADSMATLSALDREFDIDSNKLSVVTLGTSSPVDIAPFKALQDLYNISRPYFLFVGTLEPRKNLLRLLAAYSRLPDSIRNDALLVIAGGQGWGGIDIRNAIANLGLESHVRLVGYVDEPTLASLYKNALFLAMPSLYEGFGLPLVEAMAYGTPVLTSNNSSMPEVTGDAGLLIDAEDIGSIENGLTKLILDEEMRNSLADKAQNNVARFNWDESARQLITVFDEAISVRQGGL